MVVACESAPQKLHAYSADARVMVKIIFLQDMIWTWLPEALLISDIRTSAPYALHVEKNPLAQVQKIAY